MFLERRRGTAGDGSTPEPLKIIHLTDGRVEEGRSEGKQQQGEG